MRGMTWAGGFVVSRDRRHWTRAGWDAHRYGEVRAVRGELSLPATLLWPANDNDVGAPWAPLFGDP